MRASTDSRHRLFVQAAIDYMADHLAETVRLEDLARYIGLSPTYLQRIFRAQVGESPAEYARRLRLERAAWLLRRPGATVTEVALESGYGAPEAFTRAFRSRFGVSPSAYRQSLRVRRREITEAFEVVRRPPSRVACVRVVGHYDEADDAYDDLRHWAEPLGLLERGNFLGIYWDDQTITDSGNTRWEAAIEMPDELGRVVGPGIQERHLPGGAYAVVHHRGPASVRETYEAHFRDWFPRYGWKPDSRPMIVEFSRAGDWSEASLYVAVTR
ncbi:MAG: AraC family transcriptional regulator [Holophagales bacterium]|nr:AraC family transcriptional regulator [Holophagales bacterium]MYG31043.1 AraC family transcriptional regulator [Holophagales bacterium]MYI80167.1 AraC family transcriptional regulator [Holophagales bacterium]